MKRLLILLSSFLAVVLTVFCTIPFCVSAARSFSDVNGHWAAKYISTGIQRGYINGYENGTFQPNKSVTRAEFCKMMNLALGIEQTTSIDFHDVSNRNWFYNDVRRAVASGYISGYQDRSFRANEKISRQEAAVVISRIVAESHHTKNLSELTDSRSIDNWAIDGAKTVYSKGYMAGDNKKRFEPKGNLTRAEAVKIIESILNGETLQRSDVSITPSDQHYSNTLYVGDVSIYNGSDRKDIDFSNCRILGTLHVSSGDTIRLDNTKVNKLMVDDDSDDVELITSGTAQIRNTTVSSGCSLTGNGFQSVHLSGNRFQEDVSLSGDFPLVTLSTPSSLQLTSGFIYRLTIPYQGKGSEIDLDDDTSIHTVEINGASDFNGKGTIENATLNVSGSTFEKKPKNMSGSNELTASITPENRDRNVSVTDSIQLRFEESLYRSSGRSLTNAYIEDSVVELRKSRSNGAKVSFSASLSSNRRVITIDPDRTLEKDTKYYVILNRALENKEGVQNEKESFWFTTGGGLVPEVYPVDGSNTIPVTTQITLKFDDDIYDDRGSSIKSNYLEDSVMELREKSTRGSQVPFRARLSSDRETITITPKDALSTDTKYYIILKEDSIQDEDDHSNSEQIFSFTTADSDVLIPAMDPAPGSSDVDVDTEIELTFDEAVYTERGDRVTSSYLEDEVFTLRRGSSRGSTTSFDASIDTRRKNITLTPDQDLRSDTTYYLIMEEDSLSNHSGSRRTYNEELVFSFTTHSEDDEDRDTLEPSCDPRYGERNVDTDSKITLSFDEDIYEADRRQSRISSSYLEREVLELRKHRSSGDHVDFSASFDTRDNEITITPEEDLSTDSRYYVIVNKGTLQNRDGEENPKFTSYFTCGSSSDSFRLTVYPDDDTTGVLPSTNITLNFEESIYDRYGSRLYNNSSSKAYLERYGIELRSGSASGPKVDFTVDSISSYRRVTLKPNSDLKNSTTYYIVLPQGYLYNSSEESNERQVYRFTVNSGLAMTVSPTNGATHVSRTSDITLGFHEKVYSSNYEELSSSNITSYMQNIVTLKSSRGTAVDFTASISSNDRVISIRPKNPLEANTTYQFSIPDNKLTNYSGVKNEGISTSFTTSGTVLTPTISPSNGSTLVSTKTEITLDFEETLYNRNGTLLTNVDVQDFVAEIRKQSSSGAPIPFTASVSNHKKITLYPKTELEKATRYYVILRENSLANASNSPSLNQRQLFYFTTETEITLPTPSISCSDILKDRTYEIDISYQDAVYSQDGTVLSPAYLREQLMLKKDSSNGEDLAFTPSISPYNRVITLKTEETLHPNSSYYVTVAKGVLSNQSGHKNEALALRFQPESPDITVSKDAVEKRTADITVNYNYPCEFTITVDGGTFNGKVLRNHFTPNDPFGSFPVHLTELEEDTMYTVTVQYEYNGLKQYKDCSFHTDFTSSNSSLSEIVVKDDIGTQKALLLDPSNYAINITAEGSVLITPKAEDSKSSILVKGDDGSELSANDGRYTVPLSDAGDTTVSIVVTAEDASKTTYVLTLTSS